MTITAGNLLGNYEIRDHLGAGGMGEVYLAYHTQQERIVALKILPADVAHDQQRMNRFIQEAKAASRLNHPNILTIYDFGQADAAHFIATEFIEGVTLREHMAQRRLPLDEALDIAIQTASALAAAHKAGIVHRDIKPENIMVRHDDGIVKVLDFGLAKPTERNKPSLDSEAPTEALVNTDPGKRMGTVSYMSPEQARGDTVDARTDIWSFGVVLYEMVTGHKPFEGPTPSHVIVSILDREPPPLAAYLQNAPVELQVIIKKALRKNPEERYQTIRDMLNDLKNLKREMEFEAKLDRSASPELSSYSSLNTNSGPTAFATASDPSISTREFGAAQTTESARVSPRQSKPWKKSHVIALAIAGIIVVAAQLYAFRAFVWHKNRPVLPFRSPKVTRLTSTVAKVAEVAISPDGKYVAHLVVDNDKPGIIVKQVNVATAREVQVVPPVEGYKLWGLTFSKDGKYVYYIGVEKNGNVHQLYQVPVLGGEAKKLVYDIDSPVTFSPDGKRLAFVREVPEPQESTLVVANADGTGEYRLATRRNSSWFRFPAWSPDGKVIACVAGSSLDFAQRNLVEVSVEGGTEKIITSLSKILEVWRLAWLSNGAGLLLNGTADETAPGSLQIWHVSYPGGELGRITNDLNSYEGLSLSADSSTLVTVQYNVISNLWVAPNAAANQARQITSGSSRYWSISTTPDNKIVANSLASGNYDIWIMDQDGANKKQLTFNERPQLSAQASVSPDGRYVVYTLIAPNSAPHVWRMDIDGANRKQLTNGVGEVQPQVTPDGQWVVYASIISGRNALWKVPIDGGNPVQITNKYYIYAPVISPDGKLIACNYWDGQLSSPRRVAVIPFDGGEPIKTFDIPNNNVRWTPDGRALTYIDNRDGFSNIWLQPYAGGPPRQLTDFKSDRIFQYAWSRDGKQLILSRGVAMTDVVMLSEAK